PNPHCRPPETVRSARSLAEPLSCLLARRLRQTTPPFHLHGTLAGVTGNTGPTSPVEGSAGEDAPPLVANAMPARSCLRAAVDPASLEGPRAAAARPAVVDHVACGVGLDSTDCRR